MSYPGIFQNNPMNNDLEATSDLNMQAGSPLSRDQVLETLRSHGEDLRHLGVDLLVDFSIPPTFRRFMRLRLFLEDLLTIKVDLVTKNGLRDRVRTLVERDAIHVV